MKKFYFTLILAAFSNFLVFAANENYERAWKAFSENKFTEASKLFEAELSNQEVRVSAMLSLAYVKMAMHRLPEARKFVNDFIQASDDPNPYLFASWSNGLLNSGTTKERIEFLQSLLKLPQINSTIKAMASESLANLFQSKFEIEKSKKAGSAIGMIPEWSIVGCFENISASGFNKEAEFGPLAHPEGDYEFSNKAGAKVRWFKVPAFRFDRWLDFDAHFDLTNAIVYAQSFITSTVDVEAQLRIGTSGSLKVWINDQLVLIEEEERNNDLDTYISKVRLKAGNNRILIQIGSSEVDRGNFLLRFTDDNGNLMDGLQYSSEYKSYPKLTGTAINPIPVFAETFFENKVKGSETPSMLFNHLLLAATYLRNDKTFEASHALSNAEKMAPDFYFTLTSGAENFLRKKNYADYSGVMKHMKDVLPLSYDVLVYEFDKAAEAENYDEATEILEKLKSGYTYDEACISKEITIYSKTNQTEKLIKLIEDSYKQYPDNSGLVSLKYAVETKVRKDNATGMSVLKKFSDKNLDTDILDEIAENYLNTGQPTPAIKTIEEAIEAIPYGIGSYMKLSGIYYGSGNYKKAKECVEKCLTYAPYIGGYHEELGKIFEAMEEKKLAEQAYLRALQLEPTRYSCRDKLRQLKGQKELFSFFDAPDFKDLAKNAPGKEKYPDQASIVLLNEKQVVMEKSGSRVEKNFLMAKVFNSKGIDTWKEYRIDYYGGQRLLVEKAFIIKKNGKQLEADVNNNVVIYTGLEEGDMVCLVYKIENYYSGKIAQYFSDEHYFSLFIPSEKSAYRLLVDPNLTFKYVISDGSAFEPAVSNLDGYKLYQWEKTSIPAIVDEAGMPKLNDVAQVLHLSSYPDWPSVAAWYADLAVPKAKADFEVKETYRGIMKGKESASDLEKVKIIYDYIVKEIRYSSVSFRQSGLVPQKPSRVISSRIGDCKDVSTLFVTLCREAGLKANLVLVSTRGNGENYPVMPGIDFNHCIGSVQVDGKKYYAELTSDLNPFGTFSEELLYANILEIPGAVGETSSSQKMKLNPGFKVPNMVNRRTSITFEGNKIRVEKKNAKYGPLSASFRSAYRNIDKAQREKDYKEAINDEMPGIKLEYVNFDDNLNSTIDSVTYQSAYTAENPFVEAGGMELFDIPFSDKLGTFDYISLENRNFPLLSWKAFSVEKKIEEMTITTPKGKLLSSLPESKSYKSAFGEYELTFKQSQGKVMVRRSFKLGGNGVVEASSYKQYKDFMESIIRADKVKLAFKNSSGK